MKWFIQMEQPLVSFMVYLLSFAAHPSLAAMPNIPEEPTVSYIKFRSQANVAGHAKSQS